MKQTRLTTTFRLLRDAGACCSRYRHLRESLPGVGDDEPINLLTILEHNGAKDAIWAIRATKENYRKVARLMAADFAELLLPKWIARYPDNDAPQRAIKAARDLANRLITITEARKAAAAANAAADAANAAAYPADAVYAIYPADAAYPAAAANAAAYAADTAYPAVYPAYAIYANAAAYAAADNAAAYAAAADAAAYAADADASIERIVRSYLQP